MTKPLTIAELIRTVLPDPAAEQVVKEEMLNLAAQNLHQPGVINALADSLPLVKDTGIKKRLLGIFITVDTSRFSDLDSFHDALIAAFRQEKEHDTRALLLDRLSQALHQDARLAPFFIEVLSDPALNDKELAAATGALNGLPSVTEDVAVTVMARAQSAPVFVQDKALAIAERCPRWGRSLKSALVPYLNVKTDRALRRRVLERLIRNRSGTAEYVPALCTILRTDTDAGMRMMSLELLGYLVFRDGRVLPQILWTSQYDADPELRARAVALQKEVPGLHSDRLQELAQLLTSDDAAGVRLQILGLLKPGLSEPSVRSLVLSAYRDQPAVFEPEEFNVLVDMLAPYASRDQDARDTLLSSWPQLPRADLRRKLLDSLLPIMRPEDSTAWAVTLFLQERDPEIRKDLFNRLKGLSVIKNPDLARVFCTELRDPGSPFRHACARALAGAPGTHPDIVPAFEDVLLHDQDRELIRTCLDGYLKPDIVRRFDVLLAVIGNEALDLTSRQACLDQCIRDRLSDSQAVQLKDVVAAEKTGSLRVPEEWTKSAR
jgi:hypothetical protein